MSSRRVYVGKVSKYVRERDLEDLFGKYGRIRDLVLKHDYAFVEYDSSRDADDAIYYLDGYKLDGQRLIVELARGSRKSRSRGRDRDRDRDRRAPGKCYNCGKEGHWARECTEGDWKDRCYRCAKRGHIERDCTNSPRKSYSRSPVAKRRRRSPTPQKDRSRSRSRGGRRDRSYSRSRSPTPKRSPTPEQKRSRSRSRSRTPKRSRTPSPVHEKSPVDRSPSPLKNGERENNAEAPHVDVQSPME